MQLERTGSGVAFVRDPHDRSPDRGRELQGPRLPAPHPQRRDGRRRPARQPGLNRRCSSPGRLPGALQGERAGATARSGACPSRSPPSASAAAFTLSAPSRGRASSTATRFVPDPPQDVSPERLAKRGATMSEGLPVAQRVDSACRRRPPTGRRVPPRRRRRGSAPARPPCRRQPAGRPRRPGGRDRELPPRARSVPCWRRTGSATTATRPPNLALRDQLASLRWIRDEIAAFGGDPADVTAAGQSSGAVAIACLLAAPDAAGVVRPRSILQSGGLERVRSAAAATAVAGASSGARADPDFDVKLRAEPPTRSSPPSLDRPDRVRATGRALGTTPSTATSSRDHPLHAAAVGRLPAVPLLAGARPATSGGR